jgi:hypothetical protein
MYFYSNTFFPEKTAGAAANLINIKTMKKTFIFCSFIITFCLTASAQSSKTNLSLKVSAAASANRAQLAAYTWTRTVQVFIGGELKTTEVSSLGVGADGKIVTTSVSSTPASPLPGGIRGDIARKKIAEIKTYVNNAVSVSLSYLYLSKGKMVDFFDGAGISESGNTITVKGSNVNQPNDQLTLAVAAGSLAYISQNFATTVSNGDAMTGNVSYKTYSNGLTAFNTGELDLPAKNMKLMISNTNYAKKLQ